MPVFGFLALIFGIIVVANPEIIAYLIGFFFIFVGINIIAASWIFRRKQGHSQNSWKVGGYEIIKNRK